MSTQEGITRCQERTTEKEYSNVLVRRRVPQKIEKKVLDIAQGLLSIAAKFACTTLDDAQRCLHESYMQMRKRDIEDGLDLVDDAELD